MADDLNGEFVLTDSPFFMRQSLIEPICCNGKHKDSYYRTLIGALPCPSGNDVNLTSTVNECHSSEN